MTERDAAKKFANRAKKELLEYHDVDIQCIIGIDEGECEFDVLEGGYEPARIRAKLDKTSGEIGFWYK